MQQADIEAIRQLKARYCRLLDTKEWDAWRHCFTDHFKGVYRGEHPDIEFGSADELVNSNREMLAEVPTVHQAMMPEIELLSATKATGVWAMYDCVAFPQGGFEGWGHYHETYCKLDGSWKISEVSLTRLRIQPLPA